MDYGFVPQVNHSFNKCFTTILFDDLYGNDTDLNSKQMAQTVMTMQIDWDFLGEVSLDMQWAICYTRLLRKLG